MRASSTANTWLLAALVTGLAGAIFILAAEQAAIGVLFLVVAAMFGVFAMTNGRRTG